MTTEVGNFRVSTVGAYMSPIDKDKFTEVGYQRLYETMVFRIVGDIAICECGCGMKSVESWTEVEMIPANDGGTARKNHMETCRKYAAIDMQAVTAREIE